MTTSNPIIHATIVDATSLFDACGAVGERFNRKDIKIDYVRLKQRLDGYRKEKSWPQADTTQILLAIDPDSEGQNRFLAMLRHAGFEVDACHYRDAFISLPPGRTPTDATGRSTISLAARVAYIAGLMARHPSPSLLVVSHAFELCGPLSDLKDRCSTARVGVAFFGCLVDYRWKHAGLLNADRGTRGADERACPIEFVDLDYDGAELLGVDLTGRAVREATKGGGLSRF